MGGTQHPRLFKPNGGGFEWINGLSSLAIIIIVFQANSQLLPPFFRAAERMARNAPAPQTPGALGRFVFELALVYFCSTTPSAGNESLLDPFPRLVEWARRGHLIRATTKHGQSNEGQCAFTLDNLDYIRNPHTFCSPHRSSARKGCTSTTTRC